MESVTAKNGCTSPSQIVLIFTKYPTPGYAKTRLIPDVGEDGAADVSRTLSERIVGTTRRFLATTSTPITSAKICYASREKDLSKAHQLMNEWLGFPDLSLSDREVKVPQTTGDLGERLTSAFATCFEEGAKKVVVIGADIPEINVDTLRETFAGLDDSDVVIGPADDGGYYLLAMKQFHPELFRGIAWSTDTVCQTTIGLCQERGLSVAKLRQLRDIDLPEDLPYLQQILKDAPPLAE